MQSEEDSLSNQVRELQQQRHKLRGICENEALIISVHKETSRSTEEGNPKKALDDKDDSDGHVMHP